MTARFTDLMDLKVPDWVLDPLDAELDADMPLTIEKELIMMKTDFEIKPLFTSYEKFWLNRQVQEKYPSLCEKIKLLLIAFPTSYRVESGFSAVSRLLTKQRNKRKITQRGDLRLNLTKMKPDVDKLVSLHQAQPSH